MEQPQQQVIFLLVLQRLPDTAAGTLQKLFDTFHSCAGIMQAQHSDLARWLSNGALAAFEEYRRQGEKCLVGQQACRDRDYLEKNNIHLLTIEDERYPALLKQIYLPPPLLMVEGDPSVLAREQLAIVGSRRASPSGLDHAYHFAAEVAASGLVISSGLALGIDGAAHRGALSVDADLSRQATVAVVATGLDRCYPSRHESLRREIIERGAVISEFPLGTPPQKENFPRRNRIISGMSKGVLVVEAEEKSGSLITARYALEQNREVFAVPGSINNPASRGCHQLIREGARLVESVEDILAELQHPFGQSLMDVRWHHKNNSSGDVCIKNEKELADAEKIILDCMDESGASIDQLARRASLPAHEATALLLSLEINGWVEGTAGGGYRRI